VILDGVSEVEDGDPSLTGSNPASLWYVRERERADIEGSRRNTGIRQSRYADGEYLACKECVYWGSEQNTL